MTATTVTATERTAPSGPGAGRDVGATAGTAAAPTAAGPDAASGATAVSARRSRLARVWRGGQDDPRWARPALWALLALTAFVYLYDLTSSGYANEFYAAAVKSASMDAKAWLFGSLDAGNAITVDKPPASLWVMGLSARILGFSSFSLLLPQALMGVGTVALTYGAVRRATNHAFGLLAGLLVTLTPVAALMFRFDNPDAMLVLLMTGAAYAVVRAIETTRGRTALRWMVAAGALIGFAFLTKMLQGLLVLPGLGLAYVVAARHGVRERVVAAVAAVVSMIVSAGWFIALVSLWPASSRPYIGGSTNNSLWELALGYNGLGRILGGSGNGGGGMGGSGNTGFGGSTGIARMFGTSFGAEVSWLLPAALVALVAGIAYRGRAARTDTVRGSLILWGGWLVVTAVVLSFMEGTVHPYYAIALVPGIAGTLAVGAFELHRRRADLPARVLLAALACITAVWSLYLLHRASWNTGLGVAALVVTALAAAAFIALGHDGATDRAKRLGAAALIVAACSSLVGTTAWTVATISQGHNGSIPTSGPTSSAMGGGMGGGTRPNGAPGSTSSTGSTSAQGQAPTGSAPTGSTSTGAQSQSGGSAEGTSSTLTSMLRSAGTRWSAATIGDQSAAGYILSSGTSVMSIGGWSGSDTNVTLAQFQAYVTNGQIHYFVSGGQGGGPGGSSDGAAAQITAWVKAHFTATTVGGTTVYDLTNQTN